MFWFFLTTPIHCQWLPVHVATFHFLCVPSSYGELVSEFVDVIGEAVEGVGGFVGMRTVVGALA